MKKGDLFLIVLLTALCVYLFNTGNSTLCAVGITISVFTAFGWYAFLNDLGNDKDKDKE